MKKHTLTIYCCFCLEKHEIQVELPVGWETRYDTTDQEAGFCPKHSKIKEFTTNCCGCVGGWKDCDLWRSFAFSELTLTEKDFAVMKTGKCPKRTNGTILWDNATGKMDSVDISDPATAESGELLVQAIKDYCDQFHPKKKS